MKKLLNAVTFLFILLITGCNSNVPKDFSYTYVLEGTQSYRISFSLDSKKNYIVEKQNLRFEQQKPFRKEGTLTDKEFSKFKSLLSKSNLFEMKDSYGFEKEPEGSVADVLFQISYKADGKEKYVSIRENKTNKYPKPFIKLLKHTNDFISSQVKE